MNFEDYKNDLPYGNRKTDPVTYAAYMKNELVLSEKFIADVKEDLGITDNPKADKLLTIAQDLSSGGGLSGIYNYAVQLVELIE